MFPPFLIQGSTKNGVFCFFLPKKKVITTYIGGSLLTLKCAVFGRFFMFFPDFFSGFGHCIGRALIWCIMRGVFIFISKILSVYWNNSARTTTLPLQNTSRSYINSKACQVLANGLGRLPRVSFILRYRSCPQLVLSALK